MSSLQCRPIISFGRECTVRGQGGQLPAFSPTCRPLTCQLVLWVVGLAQVELLLPSFMIAEVPVWSLLLGTPVFTVVSTDLLLGCAVRVGTVLDHARDDHLTVHEPPFQYVRAQSMFILRQPLTNIKRHIAVRRYRLTS